MVICDQKSSTASSTISNGLKTKISMRIQTLDRAYSRTHVHQLGYHYPILIMNKNHFQQAVETLRNHSYFGDCAKQYHFATRGGRPVTKSMFQDLCIDQRKWFADSRSWHAQGHMPRSDFWCVFRTEQDRTLALMLL
jgi:hypothetical protein